MSVLALSKEISTYLISDLQPKKSNTAPNTDAKANFFISIYSVIANIRVFKITLFVFGKKEFDTDRKLIIDYYKYAIKIFENV